MSKIINTNNNVIYLDIYFFLPISFHAVSACARILFMYIYVCVRVCVYVLCFICSKEFYHRLASTVINLFIFVLYRSAGPRRRRRRVTAMIPPGRCYIYIYVTATVSWKNRWSPRDCIIIIIPQITSYCMDKDVSVFRLFQKYNIWLGAIRLRAVLISGTFLSVRLRALYYFNF